MPIESESSLGSDSDMENNYVIQIEEQGHNLEEHLAPSINMMLIEIVMSILDG